MKNSILLILVASCSSVSLVQEWGYECMHETDPFRRTQWVGKIMGSGDAASIAILIDCYEEALRQEKKPERDPAENFITPETAGPEVWGLFILTGQDFGKDIPKWRRWWIENRDLLRWDAANRRFQR